MTRRFYIASAMVAALAYAAPSGAAASHSAFDHVSRGAIGGNAALPTQFVGASDDGTRVFLRTEEQLAPSDTDSDFDLYERAGGVTTHLSVGPTGGNGNDLLPYLRGTSSDGRRVFFEINENLTASDTDDCNPDDPAANPCTDVYQASEGTTTLISTGPGGNGAFGSNFAAASEDGTRVFFTTDEPLSASDTDTEVDIYERSNGSTTLVSTGPDGGNGAAEPFFRGISADGSRVFFSTSEQLTAQDTDGGPDVYERSGGTTTLVSTGPVGGNSGADASFETSSESGAHVFFSTTERLVSEDTDSELDIYDRTGGDTVLVSTGPAGGNGSFEPSFKVSSSGGTRVIFQTAERLVSSDTDTATDVYERSGGATSLLSSGPAGGNADVDAALQDASTDGGRVVFGTTESLVPADTDTMFDLYERAGGTTSLVSTAPTGGNGAYEAYFSGMSRDGRRIFFETQEPLVSDGDALPDIYERANGATTRISTGAGGGSGAYIAVFLGVSDDGARVFFNTSEALASTDTDTASDVYVARTTDTYVRPKGASPVEVSLVLAYRQCTAPNRVHGPPPLGGAVTNPSCAPPVQASDHLTLGTFDANQTPVQSVGYVRFRVAAGTPSTPADEADVRLRLDINDVRRRGTLDDYVGELTTSVRVRMTDRQNGSVAEDPGTVADMPFEFVASCAATPDPGIGGLCAADTTADAVVPGMIKEGVRSAWEMDRIEVYDGGSDGIASTSGNTLFAVQGVFVP